MPFKNVKLIRYPLLSTVNPLGIYEALDLSQTRHNYIYIKFQITLLPPSHGTVQYVLECREI